ncbi:MAG: flagellar protein FlaG [Candidatus Hydrogenedentes bacterium]|nr:flagellar protein FlaG [Candidatus Hydrogenedentota bacterium]
MGVRSVTGSELRALNDPSLARTPSGGVPASAPKEAAQQAPESPKPAKVEAREVERVQLTEGTGTRLRIDNESKRIIVQIVNDADEVIKQIPPDDLLRIASKIRQIQGLLFDENA